MSKQVTLYMITGCHACMAAKEFLQEHNIEYQEFDILQDHQRAIEMVKKSQQKTVPVLDIDGEIIVGLQKERILAALGL